MDSAREVATGAVVDAESLWNLETVDKDGYECHGCGIAVSPASYEKGINKKRPYFTRGRNVHRDNCDIDGKEKLVQKATSQRVGRPEGFPVPFPNRLVLVDKRPTETPPTSDADLLAAEDRTRTRGSGARVGRHHGHTVGTIRPMCRTFMEFPHDRPFLRVSAPGCSGDTYQTLFVSLPRDRVVTFDEPTHLYFVPLGWKRATETGDHVEWLVDGGEWDTVNNRRSENTYRVRANWSTWTARQRNTVLHEMEVCRQEIKGTKLKAWLFCVGSQSNDDPRLIVVHDHRLICGLVGDMTYPSTSSRR